MATTIQIDEEIKNKLDKLKIHHRETYNDLVIRLISNTDPNKFDRESLIETIEVLSDPELIKGLREALEEEARGEKGTTLEELKKEFGL